MPDPLFGELEVELRPHRHGSTVPTSTLAVQISGSVIVSAEVSISRLLLIVKRPSGVLLPNLWPMQSAEGW